MIGAEDEAIAVLLASDVALEQPVDLVVGLPCKISLTGPHRIGDGWTRSARTVCPRKRINVRVSTELPLEDVQKVLTDRSPQHQADHQHAFEHGRSPANTSVAP